MSAFCIAGAGMVTAVGNDVPSSCAAIRCALDNFQESGFVDMHGQWQMAATVELEAPWRGREKLIHMAAKAIAEAMASVSNLNPEQTPLLLGVAEPERPGRQTGLDQSLLQAIEAELGVRFHPSSSVIARGRVSGAVGLLNARKLLAQGGHRYVLVVGVDSFLSAKTLAGYERRQRLLTSLNSNGFIPGEAAAAVVLTQPVRSEQPQLLCVGLGFGLEKATVEAEDIPLRADGLAQAIRMAVGEAQCQLHEMDYRLTDISGEQYYFKEASLALSRTMRVVKERFNLYHPSDCIGECGAAIGPAMLAVALMASRKAYGDGPNIFCHLGNDAGERAVALLSYQTVSAA